MSENEQTLKASIEALLFVADKPITVDQIVEATGDDSKAVKKALKDLQANYESSHKGLIISEIAHGFQMMTSPKVAECIKSFALMKEKRKLSAAGLETLSIVAYRQPITKQEIEYIRGVNVDGAIKTLLDKNLIRVAGRKDVPGRPLLFATTKFFLEHFGLAGLKELPKLAEFTEQDVEMPETLKRSSLTQPIDVEKTETDDADEKDELPREETNSPEAAIAGSEEINHEKKT